MLNTLYLFCIGIDILMLCKEARGNHRWKVGRAYVNLVKGVFRDKKEKHHGFLEALKDFKVKRFEHVAPLSFNSNIFIFLCLLYFLRSKNLDFVIWLFVSLFIYRIYTTCVTTRVKELFKGHKDFLAKWIWN